MHARKLLQPHFDEGAADTNGRPYPYKVFCHLIFAKNEILSHTNSKYEHGNLSLIRRTDRLIMDNWPPTYIIKVPSLPTLERFNPAGSCFQIHVS